MKDKIYEIHLGDGFKYHLMYDSILYTKNECWDADIKTAMARNKPILHKDTPVILMEVFTNLYGEFVRCDVGGTIYDLDPKDLYYKQNKNLFKKNKFYKHKDGTYIAVLDYLQTHAYGRALMAEVISDTSQSMFKKVQDDVEYDENWEEITEEQWIEKFRSI